MVSLHLLRVQVVRPDELLWFGRSPETTQLPSDEDQIANEVKKCQKDAYDKLAALVENMESLLNELALWEADRRQSDGAVSPAEYLPQLNNMLLGGLKDEAATHIYVEVVDIILTYDIHVEQILRNVKILISTTDAANKLFSKLLVGPAKALHNTCTIDLAILDEAQRFEMMPAAAVFSHVRTALVIADPHQRIVPDQTYATHNPWVGDGGQLWSHLKNPERIWVTDELKSLAAYHHQQLGLCKRCGPKVTQFCNRVFRFLDGGFDSHPCAPQTKLQFNFYSGQGWWPTAFTQYGRMCNDVAWHDKLFRCIGATILSELIDLEQSVLVWDPHAMMVLVACYLHRVLGPLAAYLKQLIENARQQGLLQHTVEANVQICIIDALTGPTAEVVHIVRHRRVTSEADQHKGNQSDPHRFYVGLTRGRISTTVWMEDKPFGLPWNRAPRMNKSTHANDAREQ